MSITNFKKIPELVVNDKLANSDVFAVANDTTTSKLTVSQLMLHVKHNAEITSNSIIDHGTTGRLVFRAPTPAAARTVLELGTIAVKNTITISEVDNLSANLAYLQSDIAALQANVTNLNATVVIKGNNLSDIPNKYTARANLGVGYHSDVHFSNLTANGIITSEFANSTQGGILQLNTPTSGTTLVGGKIRIDSASNQIRFYESGGSRRGFYVDLTLGANNAGTPILHSGNLDQWVVKKTGDEMTGPLTLSGNPTNNLHAATKQYVDTAVTDFYTKADADARFVRFDDTQGLSGEQQAQARANINAANADDILTSFVQGLTLSNNSSDPNNDIDIAPGHARGSGVAVEISSTITKRLDANWSEGNGGGGLDTGSKAANATYHVFAIRKDDDGTGDVLLSTSATSPTVPSGWTRVQRLGAVLTDGSGTILPFVQNGNKFMHNVDSGVLDYSGTSVRALSLLTVTVPNGIRVEGIFRGNINAADGDSGVILDVCDGYNQHVKKTIAISSSIGAKQIVVPFKQYTNTTRQVWLAVGWAPHPSNSCSMNTLGWIDYQIPRIG